MIGIESYNPVWDHQGRAIYGEEIFSCKMTVLGEEEEPAQETKNEQPMKKIKTECVYFLEDTRRLCFKNEVMIKCKSSKIKSELAPGFSNMEVTDNFD